MDLTVPTLGTATVRSPLKLSTIKGDRIYNFVGDDECVLMDALGTRGRVDERAEPTAAFERAGPREMLFFEPRDLRAGIVTCGGLCPGMNNAIRAATVELLNHYRVREVLGFRYGFAGLNPDEGHAPLSLTTESVEGIHHDGGSVLGSSRGPQEPEIVVDTLQQMGVGLLLVIGGDGTMRGAHAVYEEVSRRGASISVVGAPKSIDNDVPLVDKTFGYETAFSIAVESIRAAHTEAVAYRNGVGLVRLMGRHSGFIAASAAVAEADADFVLIPEVPLVLDGPSGFVEALVARLGSNGHVVGVVAEGAGQDLLQERHQAHAQVHRSELPDPQRSGEPERLGLLLGPRAKRRARRDGRSGRVARRVLERGVHARAPSRGHRAKQGGRPGRRSVALGSREHGADRSLGRRHEHMTESGNGSGHRDGRPDRLGGLAHA